MSLNEMKVVFSARSENEKFARMAVASFIAYLDPTVDELNEIKTAVSEAVTNCIIHGYNHDASKQIELAVKIDDTMVTIHISDQGKGIEDIELAREPLFTTLPDGERAGMGFTIMESFVDGFEVDSEVGKGTSVTMRRRILSSNVLFN